MFRDARRWWLAVPVVLIVAGLLTWWLWPSGSAAPRARQYRDVDACLLTDPHGLAGARVAPVWAGMQDASAATRIRVSYLAAQGEDTLGNALPYLASLLQRGCSVVLAADPTEVAAVAADAPKYPKVRFVVVGGAAPGSNVNQVNATQPATVQAQVKQAIVAATGS
jgi:basic membrane lipoprotein Med (substrate-binding protein (PBP1-ABC) superfamily)